MADENGNDWTPPYGSWATLLNLIDRFVKEGSIPAQIDRSYLSNLAYSTQAELLTTMKSLGLIDESHRPTTDLEMMVSDPEHRPDRFREIIDGTYEIPLALGKNATQQQLDDAFKKYGVTGSTLAKSVRFYLAVAKYAGIELSPHFKATRASSERKPRKKATTQDNGNQQQQPILPPKPSRDLHPFIEGLVGALPAAGESFPTTKQEAWFDTARGIFRLIYDAEPPAPPKQPEPAAPPKGGDS